MTVNDREAFGRDMREAEKTFESYVSAPTGVSMYAKEQLHVRFADNFSFYVSLHVLIFFSLYSAHATGLIKPPTFNFGGNTRKVATSPPWSVQIIL